MKDGEAMSYKINTIFTVNYDNLKNAVANIKSQFQSLKQSADNVKQTISNTFSIANEDLGEVNKKIKESTNLIDTGLKASAMGIATITIPTLLAGKSALTMAGQYESATQTLEYTLGEAKSIIDDFVEHNAQSLGMGEQEAYKFANIYSNLLTTITNDQIVNASYTNKLMKASAVIMSKTGRTFTDVSDRIRSGLLGNTEAIEDLGVNVNVSLLETTEAFKQIANDRTWEALSFQEQQQVRLLSILEQTSKKYGEEVGDNLSLKLSQTSASLENIKTKASQFLAVGLQPLLTTVNSVLSKIETFVTYLNSLDDRTKKTITTFIVIIAILPVFSMAFFGVLKAIISYNIFTKVASASTVRLTKTMLGLAGTTLLLIASIAMIAYAFGAFDNFGKNVSKTSKSTDSAVKAIDNLSAAQKSNVESAKEASEANKELSDNLQSFDEISKINIDSSISNTGLDSINPIVDLSGIDTSTFEDMGDQFGNLTEKVDEFKSKIEELKPVIGIIGGIALTPIISKIPKVIGSLKDLLPQVKASTRAGSAMVVNWGAIGSAISSAAAYIVGIGAPLAATAWGINEVNKSVYDTYDTPEILARIFLGSFGQIDQKISETTKNAVTPFIDKIKELNRTVSEIDIVGGIIEDDDVAKVKEQTEIITTELKNGLKAKLETLEAQVSDISVVPDPIKQQEYLALIEEELNNSTSTIDNYQNQINGIMNTASLERRELTDLEKELINSNIKAMGEEGIGIFSENEQEKLLLQAKFNDKYYVLNAEQVVDTVAQAKELKDKTIAEAQAEYDEKVKLAETMKATIPGFTEEMYDEMILDAQTAKDEQVKEANETYDGIVSKVKEKYPEIAKTIDFENGRALTAWEAFKVQLGEKFTGIKNVVMSKIGELKGGISETFTKIENTIHDTVNSIVSWLKDHFKLPDLTAPNIPNIKLPHFSITYDETGWGANAFKALGMQGTPNFSVQWYKTGGIFDSPSVIGVGEYPNARVNPEIVTPKNLLYDTIIQANKDSNTQSSMNNSQNNEIEKKIKLEIDLTSGGVKLGKKIIDLILDANDFYDLDLI